MRLWLLIIILLISNAVPAQKKLRYDSSGVENRSFNNTALQQYKNNKEFRYENLREPPQSLWQRFWSWFWQKVNQLLSTKEGRTAMWVGFILFGVFMIGFFVYKTTGMGYQGLFGRGSTEGLNYSVSSDDIHNISFDEAIEQAVTAGNYRLAVRLLYLQCLKRLADKGFIDWKINKTNSDYLKEVSEQKWARLFSSLTYNFDYIWYGEMAVSKERFDEVKEQFNSFNNEV